MSLIQAKRQRLWAGLIEEIKVGKLELINFGLAIVIGMLVGIYFTFVFFYLIGK